DVDGEAERLESLAHLEPRGGNPIIRASFLNQLATMLAYAGRYADVLKVSVTLASLGRNERLPFLLSPISILRARAEIGLRNFGKALRLLDRTQREALKTRDAYTIVQAPLVRSRLYLSEGRPDLSLETLEEIPPQAPRGEVGEYLLGRAL